MDLFEVAKRRPKNLEILFHAFITIKPTFVESERAFSSIRLFVTKTRNRMKDYTLDRLILLRHYYKKL